MSQHKCRIDGSSAACFEVNGELWVKEYADGLQSEGRTYPVKFCPECGFKLPERGFSKSMFRGIHIPDSQVDDSIHRFSAELGKSICEMNHNIALIKTFMSSQNTQNECFMERDLYTSQEISYLKRRMEQLEEKYDGCDKRSPK